jgi:hypothetical protein
VVEIATVAEIVDVTAIEGVTVITEKIAAAEPFSPMPSF